MQALGLIETRGLIAAIECADAMLKAAEVTLLEKTYVGGGLVTVTVTGGVAAVKAAVEAGAAAIEHINATLLISQHVIPRPSEEIKDLIKTSKPRVEEEIQNTHPVETECKTEVQLEDVSEESLEKVPEEVSEDDIFQEDRFLETALIVTNIVETNQKAENTTVAEDIAEDISVDDINKAGIDKLVQEQGVEKALEFLSKLKVTKLRNLARAYKNLKISGRTISKADKKRLLTELKEYYSKNN